MRILNRYTRCLLLLLPLATAAGQIALLPPPDPPTYNSEASYQPITGKQRFRWFVGSSIGAPSLTAGLFTAGLATARDRPVEYGPHWAGFGKRYGMRLTGISTSNAMEATVGALWGEDPRYLPAADRTFGGRIKHIVVTTFSAYRHDGNLAPAYARFIAISGNNFLSNTWRADSESSSTDALERTGWGFLGRMGKNAFDEFWPSVQRHVFHRRR